MDLDNLLESANSKLNENAPDQAISLYEEVINKAEQPNNEYYSKAKFQLGKIYIQQKSYSQAVSCLKDSLIFHEDHNNYRNIADIYVYLGLSSVKLKNYKASTKNFLEAGLNFEKLATNYNTKKSNLQTFQFYSFAQKMYSIAKEKEKANKAMAKAIDAEFEYYNDLIITSNFFNYTNNFQEAQKYAWRSFSISIEIIENMIINNIKKDSFLKKMIKNFEICKEAILSNKTNIAPKTNEKLKRIQNFYKETVNISFSDKPILYTKVERTKLIIQDLLPHNPPSFMFLTIDGRLIYYREAIKDFNVSLDEYMKNSLFAGILTAIRTAFVATPSPASGSVNEINTGDQTLLIESGEQLVVVAIVNISYPEIRKFIKRLAKDLDLQYKDKIKGWFGDPTELGDLIVNINKKIEDRFVK